MASYKLITGPATEPLTLAEAKLYLRVDSTSEDDLITALIKAARLQVENKTYRMLITQTWDLILDKTDLNESLIQIYKQPVTAISSIKYYDSNNTEQTLSATNYQTEVSSNPAKVQIITFPQIYDRLGAVTIRFVAGYANAGAVPQDIKQAMYFLIGHMYENRQMAVTGTIAQDIPFTVQYLLEPYRGLVYGF
jgi:uncharacterized phiE125 gp8 family phage protein